MPEETDVANLLMLSQDVRVLTSELRNVVTALQDNVSRGQTNTIRVDGGVFAIVACFAMLIVVIGFMIFETRSYNDLSRKIDSTKQELRTEFGPQLDQLRAWNDVNRGKIAVLEAKTAKEK